MVRSIYVSHNFNVFILMNPPFYRCRAKAQRGYSDLPRITERVDSLVEEGLKPSSHKSSDTALISGPHYLEELFCGSSYM